MINPKGLTPSYKGWNDPRFAGGKVYIPVLIGGGAVYRPRKVFNRASEAQAYAERLLATWKRVHAIKWLWGEPTATVIEGAA